MQYHTPPPDRWRRAECWTAAVLLAALAGNASAAAVEIAGVGDDMLRVIVRGFGSLAGAILAVTTIPPNPNDAASSRFAMLAGAFVAGVVSGGIIGDLLAPGLGLDPRHHDVALAAYGAGSYCTWLVLRFVGRSAARVQDIDAAISLWGRLKAARYGSAPPAPPAEPEPDPAPPPRIRSVRRG